MSKKFKSIRFVILATVLVISSNSLKADEGMWLVNNLSNELIGKMQSGGLKLSASEIYNADSLSIIDAIVALDFEGTGSIVSDKGLVITNHHVAYGDIHAVSTPDHNYLEDGFFADDMKDEIPIIGKKAYILKKIVDVTDEVQQLIEQESAEGKNVGSRRLSYLIEKRYANDEYEVSLYSMWSGSKYYLSYYEVYADLRLVAAPPVSISAFGGDIDNWEWPQHKCDFAMYRIYTSPDGKPAQYSPDNVPMKAKKYLKISTDGYKPGDFTMVLGFPGVTHRYASSANINFLQNVSYPISNKIRGDAMAIMMKWMNADPQIRLKYSDFYFNLSNVQENNEGFVQCCERFDAILEKEAIENGMKGEEYQRIISELKAKYQAVAEAEKDLINYRELFVRGTQLGIVAMKLHNTKNIDIEKEYSTIDLRVEKDIFFYAVNSYFEKVNPECWGPYQKELAEQYHGDWNALADYLWIDRPMNKEDNIYRFLNDVAVRNFNDRISALEGDVTITSLAKEYTQALYKWREENGILQYPDANSSLRLTFGKVSSFERKGKPLPWQTMPKEILAKENPKQYDFTLKPQWKSLLESGAPEFGVNFITDNDITGGNSGSPVLNADGEIIGLAFDGNKESLAGDVSWTADYNRCVNVDIRFVLWTLEKYAKTKNILKEINY